MQQTKTWHESIACAVSCMSCSELECTAPPLLCKQGRFSLMSPPAPQHLLGRQAASSGAHKKNHWLAGFAPVDIPPGRISGLVDLALRRGCAPSQACSKLETPTSSPSQKFESLTFTGRILSLSLVTQEKKTSMLVIPHVSFCPRGRCAQVSPFLSSQNFSETPYVRVRVRLLQNLVHHFWPGYVPRNPRQSSVLSLFSSVQETVLY